MEVLSHIRFKDFNYWDVKSNLSSFIYSNYEIVSLGKHIQEENTKVKPFESPKDDFKILGVNNKTGIFDNEIKKGSEINQPYKIVQNGFLAFNPYRINVGSIGLKTEKHKYNLISPAYVVFSCKKELLPEYLFLIFKTNTFNQIIRENTRGSVRQILAFDILETLKIPLPPLDIQQKIVKNYQDKLSLAKQQEQQAQAKETEIESYLYEALGIELPKEKKQNNDILQFVRFKDLQEWGYAYNMERFKFNSNYQMISLNSICEINRGGSPRPISNFITNDKDGINWIKIGDTKNIEKYIYKTKEKIKSEGVKSSRIVKEDDFILSNSMSFGKPYIMKTTGCIHDGWLLLRLNKKLVSKNYLYNILGSDFMFRVFKESTSGAVVQNLNIEIVKNIKIPLPPLKIQNQIANHIQNIKNSIQTLKQQAQQNQTSALSEFEAEIFNAS